MSSNKSSKSEPLSDGEVLFLGLVVIGFLAFGYALIPKSERQIKQEKELATKQEVERTKKISENKMTPDGKLLYTDPQTGCVYYNNYYYNSFDTNGILTPRFGKDGKPMGCLDVKQ